MYFSYYYVLGTYSQSYSYSCKQYAVYLDPADLEYYLSSGKDLQSSDKN